MGILNFFKKDEKQADNKSTIVEKYYDTDNPLQATKDFVKVYLNPQPDRYDMTYRYEHSLRVARWGKKIAEGEGWNPEPLVMACLLHDVGYPLCKDFPDLKNHPKYSAELAEKFLKQIGYNEELSKSICKAIDIHNKWNDVPEDATAFELSVRDADDLDRFDVMRICLLGHSDIGEKNATELIEICNNRLKQIEDSYNRRCGTKTAQKFWEEELVKRKMFYEELKQQMEETFNEI